MNIHAINWARTKMEVFFGEGGQCHQYRSAVFGQEATWTLTEYSMELWAMWLMTRALRERWLCESMYYVALSFSTKKLASQIRHVLNKRVVGREAGVAGRGGCSTGGTRSGGCGVAGRHEILICAPHTRAASRPAARPAHLLSRPWFCRSTTATTTHPTPPTNTYYISHYILHVIWWRKAYVL